jgi:hypothetical protein
MLASSSNEKKISYGYRERASIEVEVFLIMGNVVTRRPAVGCIARLCEKSEQRENILGSFRRSIGSNENKLSRGERERAWRRVEGF